MNPVDRTLHSVSVTNLLSSVCNLRRVSCPLHIGSFVFFFGLAYSLLCVLVPSYSS